MTAEAVTINKPTFNKPTPSFLQAGCPSRRPTISVKALKGKFTLLYQLPFNSNDLQ